MTEQEWLECADPRLMLEFLRGKGSDRKLRLFACACCRSVWHLTPDERSRAAIDDAERCIDYLPDYLLPSKVFEQAHRAAGEFNLQLAQHGQWPDLQQRRAEAAASAAASVLQQSSVFQFATPAEIAAGGASHCAALAIKYSARLSGIPARPSAKKERAAQCLGLRDIIGNPFRPAAIDPAWLTWNDATCPKIAQAIYDERAFDRLPVLADSLEEAGCTDADILGHCRSGGEHVRGCWVVDLLLGKR